MISVIIPVYNVENYLYKCVNSILCQTYKDIEIILIDDGSTDSSSSICDELKTMDNRIVVIHKNNGGLSSARNAGLKIAKGEYISFVDSDDLIHPQTFEIFFKTLIDTHSDIVFSDLFRFTEYESIINFNNFSNYEICEYTTIDSLVHLLHNTIPSIIPACAKLYKRELFNNIHFPENKLHEDEFVAHKLLSASRKTSYIKLPLYYYYRGNTNSICASKMDDKRFSDIIDAYNDRIDFIKKHHNELYEDSLVIILNKSAYLITKYKSYLSKNCYKTTLIKYKNYVNKAIALKLINPLTNFDIYFCAYPKLSLFLKIFNKVSSLCKKK